MLDEAERSLHDALCVLTQTVADSRVVLGGGWPEMQMAHAVGLQARFLQTFRCCTLLTVLQSEKVVRNYAFLLLFAYQITYITHVSALASAEQVSSVHQCAGSQDAWEALAGDGVLRAGAALHPATICDNAGARFPLN